MKNELRKGTVLEFGDYLVEFPEGFLKEDENGTYVETFIFKVERGKKIRQREEELPNELLETINTFINNLLIQFLKEQGNVGFSS